MKIFTFKPAHFNTISTDQGIVGRQLPCVALCVKSRARLEYILYNILKNTFNIHKVLQQYTNPYHFQKPKTDKRSFALASMIYIVVKKQKVPKFSSGHKYHIQIIKTTNK